MNPLLEVHELAVCFAGQVQALRGVSFTLERGESLAVVGETGSGKSTLAACLAGLIQPPEARGSVRIDGQQLLGATPETLRTVRWEKVALGLQGAPFNPVATVGAQVTEPIRDRRQLGAAQARTRARELAAQVLLDPDLLERYPHQLSGGEQRKATLAMALALDPDLVVLDEPTAGLDPNTSHQLVARIGALARQRSFALVVISHDLPDAAHLAERTIVLYAGQTIEMGTTSQVVGQPAHPYSWALINAYPVITSAKDMRPIRGLPPDPRSIPSGCSFHPRCSQAEPICNEQHPPLAPSRSRQVACHFGGLKTLLEAKDVSKAYRDHGRQVPAVRGASLALQEGESLGIIGPSGSGKTTLARILTGQLAADLGEVTFQGAPLPTSWRRTAREVRRRIQLVQQDPWDALSPRLTVRQLVREPLDLAHIADDRGRDTAVAEALDSVGLPTSDSFLQTRTHELSGGQLQRVSLARALAAQPKLLVADEPTSMLDASEQARLLVILRERQIELGLGLILVSHDMALVRKVTDRIVILDHGRIVEEGTSQRVASSPQTPAGRRLIDSAPAFNLDGDDAPMP